MNTSWNDDVSSEFLNEFNSCLAEVKNILDQCHDKINHYFQDVQSVLNMYENANSIEIPALEGIALSDISTSCAEGSIWFDKKHYKQK